MRITYIIIFFIILIVLFIQWILLFDGRNIIREGLSETPVDFSANNTTYDITNVEHQYHNSYLDTNIDASGGFAFPTYNEPNTYKYSGKIYVPNYVDSIYMSSLTNASTVGDYKVSPSSP